MVTTACSSLFFSGPQKSCINLQYVFQNLARVIFSLLYALFCTYTTTSSCSFSPCICTCRSVPNLLNCLVFVTNIALFTANKLNCINHFK